MLARYARETTRDNPWPLALLSTNIKAYVDKMSELWIEAQVIQYRPRSGVRMAFFTVRDLEQEVSITVKCYAGVIAKAGPAFDEGARVVIHCKPDFWEGNGQLSLHAKEICIQGLGDLLAQIEKLRQQLEKEGLFDPRHKQRLPFIPRKIGLVCGRNAQAKSDVIENARRRWPIASFEIREVAVQGQYCVSEVCAAISELDAIDDVDVIIVTRGGGAVEDLLPFSDERIVRTAFAARTPLVSAIGHEDDCPLLDLVADYRASTPTDAAKNVVPDADEQLQIISQLRQRSHQAMMRRLDRMHVELQQLASRPVLRNPAGAVMLQEENIVNAQQRLLRAVVSAVKMQYSRIDGLATTLQALSPQRIFDRGFSLIKKPDGTVISDAASLSKGDLLEAVFAHGSAVVSVFGTNPEKQAEEK